MSPALRGALALDFFRILLPDGLVPRGGDERLIAIEPQRRPRRCVVLWDGEQYAEPVRSSHCGSPYTRSLTHMILPLICLASLTTKSSTLLVAYIMEIRALKRLRYGSGICNSRNREGARCWLFRSNEVR